MTACNAVTQETPILTIEQPSADLTQPSIVTMYTTPATTAVVFAAQTGSQATSSVARVGAFDGWGAWPPADPTLADMKDSNGTVPGTSILATSIHTTPDSAFAFLYRSAGTKTKMSWKATATGAVSSSLDLSAGTALALVPDASKWALFGAIAVKQGNNFSITGAVKKGDGHSFSRIGCATTPIAIDAAPAPDSPRWLVAAGFGTTVQWNNNPGASCEEKLGSVGPGIRLSLISVDPKGDSGTLTQVLPMPAPLARLRMAQRSDGAWAVWSLDGGTSLSVARLTPTPSLGMMLAPISAPVGSLVTTSFDVKVLGDMLVVAAVDRVNGGNDQVQLTALDAEGATKWSTSLATDGAVDGPLSLLTAPDGASLLLAWSELPPGATTHRVRVARLDCLTGP